MGPGLPQGTERQRRSWEWALSAKGNLPQQPQRSMLAPYPPTEALLEANLMTSAHFFQSHPSSLSQNLSVFGSFPCGEAKAGLRAPEGGSLPEADLSLHHHPPATVLACSAGTLGRETTNNSAV